SSSNYSRIVHLGPDHLAIQFTSPDSVRPEDYLLMCEGWAYSAREALMHRCFTLVVPSLILLFSPTLVQGQGERGEALPRGVSEIERDVSLGASSGIQLTTLPEWAQQARFTFKRVDGGIM